MTWQGFTRARKGRLMQISTVFLRFVLLAASGSAFAQGAQPTSHRIALVPFDLDNPPGFAAPFVPEPPPGAATRFVSPAGSDANPGTLAAPWREIRWAATHVQAGDIVDIADGLYASPITISADGSAALPIVFRATGNAAIVSGLGTNAVDRDAVFVTFAAHVKIHGLKIQNAFRSGVRVDQSDHVTIQGCVCSNGGTWGIFTDFSDDLSLLGNECYGSVREHGIYHSNSGDRALIRGNYCHDNFSSGIQINADPAAGGDGISSNCVVERNFLLRNGLGTGMGGGGAAINLASVRDSVIRNNVLIANRATGIALWDDGQGTQWGSRGNLIAHNTVRHDAGQGRFAFLIWNGSTGNVLKDNLLVGGARGAISFTSDSLSGFVSDYNVLFSQGGWPIVQNDVTSQSYTLAQWQATGRDVHSFAQNPMYTNAAGGDWSLTSASVGRDTGVDVGVTSDYQGGVRPRGAGFDMGAYER